MDAMTTALEHHRAGRLGAAQAIYRELLQIDPCSAPPMHFLGLSFTEVGQMEDGVRLMREALHYAPDVAEFHGNLASALADLERTDEAMRGFQEAIKLRPDYFEAHHNFGVLLHRLGRFPEAAVAFMSASALDPLHVDVRDRLGDSLRECGRLEEAAEAYSQALEIAPDNGDICKKLGVTLNEIGELERAIEVFRRLVQLRPNDSAAHSDLLFLLQHDSRISAEELFAEHKSWASKHAKPLYPTTPPTVHVAQGRRLRVGYVSADFRDHTVPRFIGPVLRGHDRSSFEIFCYSDVARPDAVTQRLSSYVEHWRPIAGQRDDDVVELIRRDGVDILVDLAGHMGDNRMTLFARKPAPIQVSYLGYPGTTGLLTIDWRITDRWQDPPGLTEHLHTEKLCRMERVAWCYDPGEESCDILPLPALKNGYITFGALNRPSKTTPETISLWSKVLHSVGESRLLVLCAPRNSGAERMLPQFSAHGVSADQVETVPRMPRLDYLRLFSEQIDLALDTFPYSGHTTICDALWAGVPTVSLAGPTSVSRTGASILTAVGLDSFTALDEEAFVNAASLATRCLPDLAQLRSAMRDRLLNSPLFNHRHCVEQLEAAYHSIARGRAQRDFAS